MSNSGKSSSKTDNGNGKDGSTGPTRSDFAVMLDDGLGQFILPVTVMFLHMYFLYTGYEAMINTPDPLKNGLPGYQPIVYVLGYLGIVYYLYQTREGRKPVEVRAAMFIYNLYETLLSLMMFVVILKEVLRIYENPLDFTMTADRSFNGSLLAWGLWVNYHSKYLEYFDTLFMLLRNKPSSIAQLNSLHLIHHAIMGPVMWLIVSYEPGGNSYFGPCINSFIHTIMYSYYFMATLGYRAPWKQYLTLMQMIQFVFILVHSVYHLFTNIRASALQTVNDFVFGSTQYWPNFLAYTEFFLMLLMLQMFSEFYKESYNKSKNKESAKTR